MITQRAIQQRSTSRGFTLIELLTVIAIIGILAAILIPSVGAVRTKASQAASASDMKQIYLGHENYRTDGSRSRAMSDGTWSTENPNQADSPADFAKVLAWFADLNEAQLYYIGSADDVATLTTIPRIILQGSGENRTVDSNFSDAEDEISYEMARISPNARGTLPLIWTKGLQSDGEWSSNTEESPWGDDGGHILFGAGNVEWFDSVGEGVLRDEDGNDVTDIEQAFTSTDRVLRAN
ncbi:MAG: type II secretion system protein [Opitutales bacterium]